jgi:hypothetical protein
MGGGRDRRMQREREIDKRGTNASYGMTFNMRVEGLSMRGLLDGYG